MSEMLGRTLQRYRIVEKIGAGGMGEVYRARDTELDRDVAVKVLPQAFADDPQRLSRFRREARAVARLSHPNVVQIHDVGEEQGRDFVVTELLRGETLRERLARGALPWQRAVQIAREVARGLAAAHGRDIVHRDLKPGNIFLTEDGSAKILDFGLARFEDPAAEGTQVSTLEQTVAGTVLGTPGYMSPEQIRGRGVDRRTDLFSFGCVLYEMLSGRRAFTGDTAADTISSVLTRDPEELGELGVAIPQVLDRVIRRCLAKSPDERYPSGAELAAELEAIPSDVTATLLTPSEELPARPRRRWRAALWGLGGAALLLVVGAALRWGGRGLEPLPAEAAPSSAQRSVAVLPFENLTADAAYDVWREGLAELVTTGLSGSQELRVFDRQVLQQALGAAGASGALDAAGLRAAGLEADTVVLGGILRAGEKIRVQLRAQDVDSGRLLTSEVADAASPDEFFPLAETLTRRMRDALEIDVLRRRHPELAEAAGGTRSAEALRRFVRGKEARLRGDFDSAIHAFTQALEQDPEFRVASIYLMLTHAAAGDEQEARRLFPALDERMDELPARERNMLEGYKLAYVERNPVRAVSRFRSVTQIDPRDRENWFAVAEMYVWVRQYDKAVEPYEQFLELNRQWGNPARQASFYLRGAEAYFELGRYDDALEVCATGLEVVRGWPGESQLVLRSMAAALKQGDARKAEELRSRFEAEVDRARCDEGCVARNLGRAYEQAGDLERAQRQYRQALSLDADDAAALNLLARLLIEGDLDVDEGMRLVGRASELQPGDAELLATEGQGLYKLGRYERAVEVLERAWQTRGDYDHANKMWLERARTALAAARGGG